MAFQVNIVAFPDVTQLDLTGPAQVFARLPDARVTVVAPSREPIATDCGFAILPDAAFADAKPADLLCVPGGHGVAAALGHAGTVDFIRRQGANARFVTSVCTGAFLLGAAGLLRGKRATTHWGYTHLLSRVGATHEARRVVVDDAVITGGGVTAGLDFAFTVIAEVTGIEVAQAIQLALEYDPQPPFMAGRPDTAPPSVRKRVMVRYRDAAARMAAALPENVAGPPPVL